MTGPSVKQLRLRRLARASLAVAGAFIARLVWLVATDRPRFADEWPYQVSFVAVLLLVAVLLGRAASSDAPPADEE